MANFRNLEEATFENSKDYIADFSEAVQPEKLVARMFDLLKRLKNKTSTTDHCKVVYSLEGKDPCNPVDLYQHNLQSATRAMRDGADTETIVCALFHDVGELLSPRCHGEIAASLLRPYISEKNYWILQHHEIFQTYYYGKAWDVEPNLREMFSSSPHFQDCVKFCRDYDQTSFDPDYDSLSPEEFYPLVLEIFSRKPYSVQETLDITSEAKKKIGYA